MSAIESVSSPKKDILQNNDRNHGMETTARSLSAVIDK